MSDQPRYRGPWPGEVPLSRSSPAVPLQVPTPVPPPAAPQPEAPQTDAHPASPSSPEARVPDRGPTRAERREEGRTMVPVLARALSSQLAKVAVDDPAPDGWWFTPQR